MRHVQTKGKVSSIGKVSVEVLNKIEMELFENLCINYFNVLNEEVPESLKKEINELFTKIKKNNPLTEKEILASSFIVINMSSVVDEHINSIQQLLHTECVGHG